MTLGKIAGLIIGNAEKESVLLPRDEVEKRIRSFTDFSEDLIEGVEDVRDKMEPTGTADEVHMAAHHAIARMDRYKDTMMLWLAEHARDAWRRARTELAQIVPAGQEG